MKMKIKEFLRNILNALRENMWKVKRDVLTAAKAKELEKDAIVIPEEEETKDIDD